MTSPLPPHFIYRLDLAGHVTPRLIRERPVHRWFYFPHSFSPQLVELLLDEWQLPPDAVVFDPFGGAGTTVRVAAERSLDALGTDLSPLAVTVSNAKTRTYDDARVRRATAAVLTEAREAKIDDLARTERLVRSFSDAEFAVLLGLREAIGRQLEPARSLLLLALLRVQQRISRAQPDGGWFRWVERDDQSELITPAFAEIIEHMLADLAEAPPLGAAFCETRLFDARRLEGLPERYPGLAGRFRAIITSPPYANRHDYSRIFQIELLTLGLQESDIFRLRYESIRSNVEARPPDQSLPAFKPPTLLLETLAQLPDKADRRIEPMLCGYFEDMNAVLAGANHILEPGGYVAFVVGNVRHAGVMVPVDEILHHMGEPLGFEPLTSWVARLRGNSAQQMGRYGRQPARESVVILRKASLL